MARHALKAFFIAAFVVFGFGSMIHVLFNYSQLFLAAIATGLIAVFLAVTSPEEIHGWIKVVTGICQRIISAVEAPTPPFYTDHDEKVENISS